jgi:hypothetical protein
MPRPASPPPRLLSAAAKAAQDGWTVRIWREGQPPITVAVDEGGADKVASDPFETVRYGKP